MPDITVAVAATAALIVGIAIGYLVRRYLVTGIVSAGRRRQMEHDTIVTAMTQLARWGAGVEVFGDQPEWASARQAVASLMERYHRA